MSGFFDKTLQEQVYIAIDKNDPVLLQVLLGPKYCQLWRYWLMHAVLAYDISIITGSLNALPIDILNQQSQVLAKSFPFIYCEPQIGININLEEQKVTKKQIQDVNNKLMDVEHKMLKTSLLQVRPTFNSVDKEIIVISSFYKEENEYLRKVINKFKDDISFKYVLRLDLSQNYNDIHRKVCRKIIEKYKLEIKQGDLISNLYKGPISLAVKIEKLKSDLSKLDVVTNIIKEVINKIKDERFVEEMYDQLLLNVANGLLSSSLEINTLRTEEEKIEKIKEKVKGNNDCKFMNKCMEYAVSKKVPNINIIKVLIVNGASLMNSYIIDPKQNQSITIREHFLNNLKGKYASIVNKSIYIVMMDVHKMLFNFPIIKNDVNLVDVISAIPSADGSFSKDIKDMFIFDKIGEAGAKEFISLLKNTIDKYVHEQEHSSAKDMWLKKICMALFGKNSNNVDSEDYKDACEKLYESLSIGYLAVVTGDNKIIIDYIEEIEEAVKNSKNTIVKELCGDFLKLLSTYKELPKKMFLMRWCNYIHRTVKSYTWEWDPAWEKVLTGPGYHTEVAEWSKDKFEELEKAEKAQSDTKNIQMEKEKEEETKARKEAEKRAEQSDKAKQNAEERADQAEKRADQAKEKADQKIKQIEKVTKAFTKKMLKIKDEKLRDLIVEDQSKIVKAVIQCVIENNYYRNHYYSDRLLDSLTEEIDQVLATIIEEIKLNKKQIIEIGEVSDEIIEQAIENFNSQGTLLTDINVSEIISKVVGRDYESNIS